MAHDATEERGSVRPRPFRPIAVGLRRAIGSLRGAIFRIFEVSLASFPADAPPPSPGTLAPTGDGGPGIACADGEAVRLEAVYSDDGLFSGARFLETYGVSLGDPLTVASTPAP